MLTVESLSVAYDDAVAVRDVSLRVDAGEAVALLGANGAGKTTVLRTVCGLQPARAGAVHAAGVSLLGRPAHRIARAGVAFVPAERHLFGGLTVADNLALGAHARRADRQRWDLVFDVFPVLADRRRQRAGTLSGGEQQMVAIGRALLAGPRVLVLDEPTTGLAPRLAEQTYRALGALRADGLTVLLAEQHAGPALGFADRGYVLRDGRVALAGTAASLAADPGVRRAYLGPR